MTIKGSSSPLTVIQIIKDDDQRLIMSLVQSWCDGLWESIGQIVPLYRHFEKYSKTSLSRQARREGLAELAGIPT